MGLILAFPATALAAQAETPLQDPRLDRLSHEPGYITAPIGRLGRVEVRGGGDVDMLLIPGWGFDGGVYSDFVTANEDRYRMFVLTLPGYGGTAAPPMPAKGTSYAEGTWTRGVERAISALLSEHDLHRPIVVGHSIHSASLALRLALDHPNRLGGVVIIAGEPVRPFAPPGAPGAPLTLTPEERSATTDEIWADGWFKTVTRITWDANMFTPSMYSRDPERGRQAQRDVERVPLAVMIRYLLEHFAVDVTTRLRLLEVPALILIPDFHDGIRDASARALLKSLFIDPWDGVRSALPAARVSFETVDDTGLLMMSDRADLVSRLVAEFVAGVDRGEVSDGDS